VTDICTAVSFILDLWKRKFHFFDASSFFPVFSFRYRRGGRFFLLSEAFLLNVQILRLFDLRAGPKMGSLGLLDHVIRLFPGYTGALIS